jgi:hypothetical protein
VSTTAPPVPPYVFEQKGTFPAPYTFDVPASLEVRPDTATAKFDGTNASGPFLACLTMVGSDGERLGRWFNPTILQPGDKAEVTYTPPFGSAATSAAPGGSGWQFDTDNEGGWGRVTSNNFDPANGNFGLNFTDTSGDNLGDGGINIETDGTPGQGISLNETTGAGISLAADMAGGITIDSTSGSVIVTASVVNVQSNNGDLALEAQTGDLRLKVGVLGSKLNIHGLPLAAAGLVAGDVWNNGGVLTIV